MNSDPPSTWRASRARPQGNAHAPYAPIDVTLQSVSPCSPGFLLSSDIGVLNDDALDLVERNLIARPIVEFRRARPFVRGLSCAAIAWAFSRVPLLSRSAV